MHAPLFHPAMKNVAPIRRELGVKTFFNMLGPMVNPAFPTRQLVGVFSLELARQYGYLYQQTGKSFTILHAVDGYDEVSLTGGVKIFCNQGEHVWEPADLGFIKLNADAIRGGDTVEESAAIFTQVLEGRGTPAQQDVVLANATLALWAADQSQPLGDVRQRATEALVSGRAAQCFQALLK
jgi:anthranilate phosphoribosyltransferase